MAAKKTKPPALPPIYAEAAHEMHTLRDFVRFAVSRMNEAELFFGHGSANAFDEAVYLVLNTLDLPLDRIEPFYDALLMESEKDRIIHNLFTRVDSRKPLAYVINEAWLSGHAFYVDERVIVPRSFIAELLQPEQLNDWLPTRKAPVKRVLDLCTGGGSLAILAAEAFPQAEIDAVDLSADALEVAHLNVEAYGLEGRVYPIEGDLFAPLKQGSSTQKYDVIISNPPYVNQDSMAQLPDEYQAEPALALASGDDGLDHTRLILAQAKAHLSPGGVLVVEIGHNRLVLEAAFPKIKFHWPVLAGGDGHVFILRREQLP